MRRVSLLLEAHSPLVQQHSLKPFHLVLAIPSEHILDSLKIIKVVLPKALNLIHSLSITCLLDVDTVALDTHRVTRVTPPEGVMVAMLLDVPIEGITNVVSF